ncbi:MULTISPECIES: D-2-hydroxyacid dehydrogenase [Zhongshania]|jgi:glycerate dehydrogenase|uniref:Glycerate dehydrogenase n=1 Tax=Zhongshania antarctica TaxID=641702 RepID=A0A840R9S3_9GAMM|nr:MULTISPECIES: D-2-hydroxyacid dehydrogenase [Zhongshania]MBB5189061.1 glycerate dehydrogenase [Zhongshania antarctica]
MHGVFLDLDSLAPADVNWQKLRNAVDSADVFPHTPAADIAERIAGADVVFSNKVQLKREHFASAKQLKLVVVLATGTNNIDLAAAAEFGVTVCNNVAYSSIALVEHSAMLILALMRQLPSYHAAVQQGQWQTHNQFCLLNPPIRQLSGKTLGIIGYGASGQGVADFGRAMGMNILAWQSRPGTDAERIPPRLALDALLPQCDVLSIHCPLNEQTRDLINFAALQKMKPDAILINTARGGIVNEADLARALNEDLIGGAGVDVLTEEPPRNGNPLLSCKHPNLIVTPHNAWGSREARQALIDQSVRVVAAFRRGEAINIVNGC